MKITKKERNFMAALIELTNCNPFLPERMAIEKAALGAEYCEEDYVAWSLTSATEEVADRPNVARLASRAEALLDKLSKQLVNAGHVDDSTLELYEGLALYVFYHRHIRTPHLSEDDSESITESWDAFRRDAKRYLGSSQFTFSAMSDVEHLFAVCCQVRRAFCHIFNFIIGDSMPAAKLRATVWQSIFTHDLPRYRSSLYDKMSDISTLITGPSGTGKELVARAIGLSQYSEFDGKKAQFKTDWRDALSPMNLSALSPTLIESELFGHTKGSFTGAVADRVGWLEKCRSDGSVFLDEIGELDPTIQVKLLRVVQNREFVRLGETSIRPFRGKIITATNRDLRQEMLAGRFREDFYYRLCADRIVTPSLRDHLDDRPAGMAKLIRYITSRIAGEAAESLANDVEQVIATQLGPQYSWPGNIRELEQCVRSVMIRRTYTPERYLVPDENNSWLAAAERRELSLAEITSRYCTWVYAEQGSYEKTASVLEMDRRTVKSRIDQDFLATLH